MIHGVKIGSCMRLDMIGYCNNLSYEPMALKQLQETCIVLKCLFSPLGKLADRVIYFTFRNFFFFY